MRCPKCQFLNTSSTSSCGGCGASLADRCGNCAAENPKGFKFCGACGSKLTPHADAPVDDSVSTEGQDNAERRQLTVMFCDLVESTSLSEQLDPEDLRDVVRRYQQVVADVVAAFGGHVAQYLGDGMLIYFGYPVAHEDDPRRAALASLGIVAAVGRLDAELDVSLKVRIGLHTGPVVAGEVGARGRTELLALGPTPNIAARVQSEAQPGEVLLSGDTRALIGDEISTLRVGPLKLRGVAEPVTIYKIEAGKRQGADAAARERTPFVGRERELDTLVERFERARDRQGQIVLLKGEAGIGKSRLHQELRRRVAGDDVAWLHCRCSPFHQNSPLHPIIELLGEEMGLRDEIGVDARRRRVARALTDLDVEGTEALSLLTDILSVAPADPEPANMTPDRRRKKTLELLVELLLRVGARRTAVLVVEDLHWADPTTLTLLTLLAERIADQCVLAIFTQRPAFAEGWQPMAHQTLIELRRLNNADVASMVDAWAAGRLPATVREAVVARTDGVPLFIEELTRTLLDIQRSQSAAGDALGAESLNGLIPNTLRDLLMARLDALGRTKETAQLGAVLGRQFTFDELSAVGELPADVLGQQLTHLADAGILMRSGHGIDAAYVFKHALIQEAAYDSLLRRRRAVLHDRAAAALEARNIRQSDPRRLARHYEGANRWREASDLYFQAATQAHANWAYAEAIATLRKSLELLSRTAESRERDQLEFEILTSMVPPMSAHFGYTSPELFDVHERRRSLARRLGPEFAALDVLFGFWAFYAPRGDRQQALQLAQEIQGIADAVHDPGLDALAGFVSGATQYYVGDRSAALAHLERAVTHFSAIREQQRLVGPNPLFLAWLVHSVALCDAGRIDEGWASIADAVAFAEAHGDPFNLLQALDHQIWAALNLGSDLEDIARIARRVERLRQEYEIGWWDSAAIHIGGARVAMGDATAIAEMRKTVETTRSQYSGIRLALELVLLGRALSKLGRFDEARACLDEGLERCQTTLAGFPESENYCMRAEIAWRQGDAEQALLQLDRSMQIAQQQGAPLFELRAALLAAKICDQQQRPGDARHVLERVVAKFRGGAATPYLSEARSMLEALTSAQATSA